MFGKSWGAISGWVAGLGLLLAVTVPLMAAGPNVDGAIFTTTGDGTVVNENTRYGAKSEVYLNGGPQNERANGLPDGYYYFQVTDPSGKDLLSSDHISCRRVRVNDAGVIAEVYAGFNWAKQRGAWTQVACRHAAGVDADHAADGAITVQLFPFDDTPNPGGVYKVWVTRTEDYAGDPNLAPPSNGPFAVNGENWQAANAHGFIPARSKTDNYKVKLKGKPFSSPLITVQKFHDANLDGVQNAGEETISGWPVDVTDPSSVTNTVYTTATVTAPDGGTYLVHEQLGAGTIPTVSTLDGAIISRYPTANPLVPVSVAGLSGETHTVVFGNAGTGSARACKVYDRNADGVADADEPGIAGWRFTLVGTDVTGAAVGPTTLTAGNDGCATFGGLLPGTYTVAEVMPASAGWIATGATTSTFAIASNLSGATIWGTLHAVSFTNTFFASADFGTKGYWHNKNGLQEIVPGDVSWVNAQAPYSSASSYFSAGDEPFDGLFADGSPVAGASGAWGEEIAPAGSTLAEISHFLVDSNAGGDPREQLAQQLLAFIFNARHRIDDPGAALQMPDGSFASAADLIAIAVDIWVAGSDEERHAIASLLDGFNNGDAIPYVPFGPPAPAY